MDSPHRDDEAQVSRQWRRVSLYWLWYRYASLLRLPEREIPISAILFHLILIWFIRLWCYYYVSPLEMMLPLLLPLLLLRSSLHFPCISHFQFDSPRRESSARQCHCNLSLVLISSSRSKLTSRGDQHFTSVTSTRFTFSVNCWSGGSTRSRFQVKFICYVFFSLLFSSFSLSFSFSLQVFFPSIPPPLTWIGKGK